VVAFLKFGGGAASDPLKSIWAVEECRVQRYYRIKYLTIF
jgi:hypothetical protein